MVSSGAGAAAGGGGGGVRQFTPLLGVLGIFTTATVGLYLVALTLSQSINDGESPSLNLSFPKTLDELRSLSSKLRDLKEQHFFGIVGLFTAAYLYKQSFAIPGSVFLNLLAGALFGVWYGLPTVCLLTAVGASFCYTLSYLFGKELVWKYFSRRIQPLEAQLNEDGGSLLFLLISLRVFPMSPNWLLNILSPLLGIPIHLFFISVFIGLLPYNFLCVQAGLVLSELEMLSVMDIRSVCSLILATLSLLVTALLLRMFKKRTLAKTT